MILQGCVKGAIYPVTQQAYEEPIDATHTCKECGRKYAASGRGCHTYCSDECRKASLKRRNNIDAKKYQKRKIRERDMQKAVNHSECI